MSYNRGSALSDTISPVALLLSATTRTPLTLTLSSHYTRQRLGDITNDETWKHFMIISAEV